MSLLDSPFLRLAILHLNCVKGTHPNRAYRNPIPLLKRCYPDSDIWRSVMGHTLTLYPVISCRHPAWDTRVCTTPHTLSERQSSPEIVPRI